METRYADVSAAARAADHQDLRAWQAAVELAVECYLRTASFPWIERYRLVAGMRRAAAAAVAHIAEGCDPSGDRLLPSRLRAAYGAVREVEAQFGRAASLGYVDAEAHARARTLCEVASRTLRELGAGTACREPAAHTRRLAGTPVPPDAVIQ
jgi:four helix bundle protein